MGGHVALRSRALLIAVSLFSAQLATAQERASVASARSLQLSVRVQGDGRLVVTASNAPIDEVIRAVAAAAGIQISALGASPQDRVTVTFVDAPPARILRELMEPAGISYVMTTGAPGRPGRLLMGVLDAHGVDSRRDAVFSAEQSAASSPHAGPVPEDTTANARQTPPLAQGSDPTEWPTDVQPVNIGPAFSLPETREALFQLVNGSAPVSLPAGVTPNAGGTERPDQLGPVNPLRPVLGFGVPGMSLPSGEAATRGEASRATTPPDASMLQVPTTIQIPAPVVVQFPPPSAP